MRQPACITTILSLAILLAPVAASATVVTVSDDTTLTLSSDGSNYTLLSGGTFDQLDITTSSFVFSMSTGETVTVTSADKKALSPNPAFTVTCGSSQSSVTLTVPSTLSSQAVTLTPSGTCSGSSSTATPSTGGGGTLVASSGGGSSSTPTPTPVTTPATPQTPAAAPAPSSGGNQNSSPAPAALTLSVFFKNLSPGNRNDEVRQLQSLLDKDKSLYPEGIENGIFGPATVRAVKRFQKKYGIRQTGTVGPQTRTKLMQVFGQQSGSSVPPPSVTIQTLQDQLTQLLKQLQQLQKDKK